MFSLRLLGQLSYMSYSLEEEGPSAWSMQLMRWTYLLCTESTEAMQWVMACYVAVRQLVREMTDHWTFFCFITCMVLQSQLRSLLISTSSYINTLPALLLLPPLLLVLALISLTNITVGISLTSNTVGTSLTSITPALLSLISVTLPYWPYSLSSALLSLTIVTLSYWHYFPLPALLRCYSPLLALLSLTGVTLPYQH